MIINNCKKIVGGSVEGPALVTSQPINFLSMVDAKTGKITDPMHELYKKSLKGVVLVFPYAIGSSVDRKSKRLNSSHTVTSYAVFCWKKKNGEPAHEPVRAVAELAVLPGDRGLRRRRDLVRAARRRSPARPGDAHRRHAHLGGLPAEP